MSAVVVGVDASFTGTGLATWRDGLWTLSSLRTPADDPVEQRIHDITAQLWPLITRHCLVVVEAPIPMRGIVALELAMLHGVLVHGLWARMTDYTVVNNTHVKQYATGNGRAGKPAMVAAARDRLHLPVHSHDQADAAWLAAMGLHHYGNPLCPTTTVQDEAVAKQEWPTWQLIP